MEQQQEYKQLKTKIMNNSQTICELITQDGFIHYKIFSKELAEHWNLKIVFIGSYEDCAIKLPTLNKHLK